jgi:hypothetical protein
MITAQPFPMLCSEGHRRRRREALPARSTAPASLSRLPRQAFGIVWVVVSGAMSVGRPERDRWRADQTVAVTASSSLLYRRPVLLPQLDRPRCPRPEERNLTRVSWLCRSDFANANSVLELRTKNDAV